MAITKLTAGLLRRIIQEEVEAVRKFRTPIREATITAKEYRLFKALLRKHPELSNEMNEDEVDALKVAEVLNWAMGEPYADVTDADDFFSGENTIQYWMADEGPNVGQLVVELQSSDGGASGGCIPTATNLKQMGMKSHKELEAFLDDVGAKAVRNPSMLSSHVGREAAGPQGRKSTGRTP